MGYKISVARKVPDSQKPYWNSEYYHNFSTDPDSIRDEITALEVFHKLKLAFPKPEYEVSVVSWREYGEDLTEAFEYKLIGDNKR